MQAFRAILYGMNECTPRSDCPINYLLELVGDKWTLLIVRDILLNGKSSYGEFLASDEKIATNILASRLTSLESAGFITKNADPENKKKFIYSLTEKGLDLIPLYIEIILWSAKHSPLPIPDDRKDIVAKAKQDKATLVAELREQFLEQSKAKHPSHP